MPVVSVKKIIDSLEEFMADIGHDLMIKYGLPKAPSSELIRRWNDLTQSLISQGYNREDSGSAAAKNLFVGYNTMLYASEADTIESLLARARGK